MLLNTSNPALVRRCHSTLSSLLAHHRQTYLDLFFFENDIRLQGPDLSPLLETGILRKIRESYRANVQVIPISGRFICTDFFYSRHRRKGKTYFTQRNGVWAILPEETPILAQQALVKNGDTVLDLACGSGMIGIFCAKKAKHVICSDINARAVHFARFNAMLNGVDHNMEFVLGNLFSGVKKRKFDLIIWNGPTVAVPVNRKYPVYSSGGRDGAEFTRRFIDEAPTHLRPNGRLHWYDCALGDDTMPVSLRYLIERSKNKKVRITWRSLTRAPVSLAKTFDAFERDNFNTLRKVPLACERLTAKEWQRWLAYLVHHGLTHHYFALLEVIPSKRFSVKRKFPRRDIRTNKYLNHPYWLWQSKSSVLRNLKKMESYAMGLRE